MGVGNRLRLITVSELVYCTFIWYIPPAISSACYSVPSQVQISSVSRTASSGSAALTVSWTAPSSDVPITGYKLSYKESSERNLAASTMTYTITNLQPGTLYQVRVRAVSPIGEGEYGMQSETTYSRE